MVQLKSALVKQRHVDESKESRKAQTGQNQVNIIAYRLTTLTTSRDVEAFCEVDS